METGGKRERVWIKLPLSLGGLALSSESEDGVSGILFYFEGSFILGGF
jgi:hypothetical protein